MMKKKVLIAGLLLTVFGPLFASEFHSALNFAIGQVTDSAIATDKHHIQVGYGFEITPIFGNVGFQLSDEAISFATDASYQFLDFNHFKVFAKGFFWAEYFINETFSTDTLLGVKFKIPIGRIFCFTTDMLGVFKTTKIFALKNNPAFLNFDFACSAMFAWKVLSAFEIFASFASYEYFYHPNFFAPIWTLGANYEFNEKILGCAEFSIRTIDFFALSSYIDGFSLRLKVECKLK